jgi:hypothetical protein
MEINKEKVPESYYARLVELMGKEKTERFLHACDYNFKAIAWRISWLEFIMYVKKKPRQAILIIVPIFYLLMRILWIFVIEPVFF